MHRQNHFKYEINSHDLYWANWATCPTNKDVRQILCQTCLFSKSLGTIGARSKTSMQHAHWPGNPVYADSVKEARNECSSRASQFWTVCQTFCAWQKTCLFENLFLRSQHHVTQWCPGPRRKHRRPAGCRNVIAPTLKIVLLKSNRFLQTKLCS